MNSKTKIIAIVSLLILVIIYGSVRVWQNFQSLPEGLIQVSGRLEGNEVSIASKIPGKIIEMKFKEGDEVKVGDVMFILDSRQADAKLLEAKAGLMKAQAQYQQAVRDNDRFSSLAKSGAIDKRKSEEVKMQMEMASAGLQAAEAQVAEAQTIYDDHFIHSPISGRVMIKVREVGEIIPAGASSYTVMNMDELFLKAYIPEKEIGKIKVGTESKIYIDAFPDQEFDAEVRMISSQAEFTPKEVQTTDERVKLTYALKAYLRMNPEHKLTPGIPADAVLRWKESVPWRRPKW